jgi:hypothetical protein
MVSAILRGMLSTPIFCVLIPKNSDDIRDAYQASLSVSYDGIGLQQYSCRQSPQDYCNLSQNARDRSLAGSLYP